jgi:hypothetical protein
MRTACIILLLLSAFLLTACAGSNTNQYINPYEKYYTGTRGVVANYENLPTTLYYYGPEDNAGNTFTFSVDADNQGASFTRGGVYVSGFDPNLLIFQEIPIAGGAVGACGISIGNVGWGELGGILRCDGFSVSSGGGVTNVQISDLSKLINGIAARFGDKQWLDPAKFNMKIDYTDGPAGSSFVINMNDMQGNLEYYQHGRLFIAWFAGLDFTKNGGREFLLAGDTYEFPGGERAYLTYNGQIVNWPPGLDQTTQHMLLTTCYQYTTFADPMVCIDPEPFSNNRKVCQPKSRTWNGGNGAPVAVTSIEQENTPRKIIFHINVRNVGVGTVYDPGKLEKCSPYYPGRVGSEDLNLVYLGDVRLGSYGLRSTSGALGGIICSPAVIRLDPKTKSGSTTCTYPIEYNQIKSAYTAPLAVELWYGYSEALQRDITVKRIT